MKKIFSVIVGFAFAVGALAQTAEEILAKMEEVFDRHEEDGVSMVVETKIPILGASPPRKYAVLHKFRPGHLGPEDPHRNPLGVPGAAHYQQVTLYSLLLLGI